MQSKQTVYIMTVTKLLTWLLRSEDVLRQRLLQKTYEGEQNLNCFVLAAKLLLSLQSNDLSEILRSVPFTLQEYWNRLVGYFDVKCSQSVIESVLPLLGALTAQVRHDTSISR